LCESMGRGIILSNPWSQQVQRENNATIKDSERAERRQKGGQGQE